MRFIKRLFTIILLLAVAITAVPYMGLTAEAAYTPLYSTVKVGLNSPLRPSRPEVAKVTLANSSGFDFGSYDSSRNFAKSGETAAGTIVVNAAGGTVTVTDSSGAAVASGSSRLAVVPKSDTGTSYTLPSSNSNYSYYGGFEFICSGSTMTVVNYVDIEKYVMGVVPYEMSASWPKEALKAQALCARTYVASHFDTYSKQYGFDVCNTTSCQVYNGVYTNTTNTDYVSRVKSAVEETAGQYILYDGTLISAYFHASSGGATENSENVWSAARGYLKGVEDIYENTRSEFILSATYTPAEICSKMKAKDSTFNLSDVSSIACEYTAMGNMYSVTFKDSSGNTKTYTKENCRTKVLGAFSSDLKYSSQRFTISEVNTSSLVGEEEAQIDEEFREIIGQDEGDQIITEAEGEFDVNDAGEPETEAEAEAEAQSPDNSMDILENGSEEGLITENIELMADKKYTISSRGYGHNVGMSQYGAKGAAEAGKTYDEIISYYYTGVTISSRETPFSDVAKDKWYHDAIVFVYQNGLMKGTSSNKFEPEVSMTRGQLVTVLGRMSNISDSSYCHKGTITGASVNFRSGPGTSHSIIGGFSKDDVVTIIGKSGGWYQVIFNGKTGYVSGDYLKVQSGTFSDVSAGEYYTGYVEWAAKMGIVEGYSATEFGPKDPLNREQMCAIINRYAKLAEKNLPEKVGAVTFSDDAQISNWARDAVGALQKAGIVQGMGNNLFSPGANCSRAQVAQILKNYLEL